MNRFNLVDLQLFFEAQVEVGVIDPDKDEWAPFGEKFSEAFLQRE